MRNLKYPFPSFHGVVTPCKTVAQYYNQKIDIDKIHQCYLDYFSISYTCVCTCTRAFSVCNFITAVGRVSTTTLKIQNNAIAITTRTPHVDHYNDTTSLSQSNPILH